MSQMRPDLCRGCALLVGYDYGPEVEKWALTYVQAEKPIPETWRNAFYDELVHQDLEYRRALEDNLKFFGVRFV
jgi:hypothetical protein